MKILKHMAEGGGGNDIVRGVVGGLTPPFGGVETSLSQTTICPKGYYYLLFPPFAGCMAAGVQSVLREL